MRLPRLTLAQLLNWSVERYHSYYFVSYTDSEPYTYAEFSEKILRLRRYLRDRGVKKGTKVALISENQPNWGICYFAVATLGAVVVPVLPDFHPEEIASILEHSEAEGVFISKKMYDKTANSMKGNKWLVRVDDFAGITSSDTTQTILERYTQESTPEEVPRIPEETDEDDCAVIIYTSGTTGSPKGVVLSHRNIVHNVLSTTTIPKRLRPGDRLLSILPLAHTYESTIGFFTPLILGCRIFYLRKPPAPVVLLPALEKVRPQVILSVPLLIEKIYRNLILPKLQKHRLVRAMLRVPPLRKSIHRFVGRKLRKTFGGKLKYFIVGGAALAEDVEKFLWEAKFPLAVGYGLTETSPLIAGSTEENAKFGMIGPPLSGISVKVDSQDPENKPGEILVKGPNVMHGYYKNREKTEEVLTEDGWFHTGDLGILDSDGFVAIRGRLKNIILGPNGENIYPEAIEAVLSEYQFVNDAVVFEQGGKIFARVHIDYDAFVEQMKGWASSAWDMSKDVSKSVGDYLAGLRKTVNSRLNSFSRVHAIFEQKEPFEKTPTKKIKRYLYTKEQSPEDKGTKNADNSSKNSRKSNAENTPKEQSDEKN